MCPDDGAPLLPITCILWQPCSYNVLYLLTFSLFWQTIRLTFSVPLSEPAAKQTSIFDTHAEYRVVSMTLWKALAAPRIGCSLLTMYALLIQKELILRTGDKGCIDEKDALQGGHLLKTALEQSLCDDLPSLWFSVVDPLFQQRIEMLFDLWFHCASFLGTINGQGQCLQGRQRLGRETRFENSGRIGLSTIEQNDLMPPAFLNMGRQLVLKMIFLNMHHRQIFLKGLMSKTVQAMLTLEQ